MTTRSGAASGGEIEDKLDLSIETKSKIDQAQSLISASSDLTAALSLLLAHEKKCRVGNDVHSLVKTIEASLQFCKDCNDDEALISTLKTISTRRSQKAKAITALLHKAMPWVLQSLDDHNPLTLNVGASSAQKQIRESIVVTLRDITDGKLFLEAERARLTRALAIIKEEDGYVADAADILQEVHVETYGSLSKREKVEFILEQIRLTLEKKDFVRAAIVANKINKKVLGEEGMEHEKILYYKLMLKYHQHQKDAFQLAKDYHHIYSTVTIQGNEDDWKSALTNTVTFLVLSAYSNEQQDMMNRLNLDPKLDKIPACKNIIKLFLKREIIKMPTPFLSTMYSLSSIKEQIPSSTWPKIFHTRVIQHNIRIAAQYYSRIHGRRLAQLLNLTTEELELEIATMVSEGSVCAKIDRPQDIVRFKAFKTPEEILSEWGSDIKSLLHLVDSTTHLIHKENMTQ